MTQQLLEHASVTNTDLSTCIQMSMSDNEDDLSYIIDMQTKSLYKNPIFSALRELICNAKDANIEAGNGDIPVKITIPDNHMDQIKIKDNGIGMSPSRIENNFMKLFSSTKKNDGNQIGKFGVGCKSINCLSDINWINTVHEGMRYEYIYFVDNGRPKLDLLNSELTDESSGTELVIPSNRASGALIYRYVRQICYFFDPYPDIVGGEFCKSSTYNRNSEHWTNDPDLDWVNLPGTNIKIKKDSKSINSALTSLVVGITYNNLIYSSTDQLPGITVKKALNQYDFNHYLSNKLEFTTKCWESYSPDIIIPFDVNDLKVTTSRDSVELENPSNIKIISEKMTEALKQYYNYQLNIFKSCKTLKEFFDASMFDTNVFLNSGLELPLVEKGPLVRINKDSASDINYINSIGVKSRKERNLRLKSIKHYIHGSYSIEESISAKDLITKPIYVETNTKKYKVERPDNLDEYYVITFTDLSENFHKKFAGYWNYPKKFLEELDPTFKNEVKPQNFTFEKVVALGRFKSIHVDQLDSYPTPTSIVARSDKEYKTPTDKVVLYINSNAKYSEKLIKEVLKAHGMQKLYVVTPSVELVLPSSKSGTRYIEFKDFILQSVMNMVQKSKLWTDIVKNCVYSNKRNTHNNNWLNLAKKLATELKDTQFLKFLKSDLFNDKGTAVFKSLVNFEDYSQSSDWQYNLRTEYDLGYKEIKWPIYALFAYLEPQLKKEKEENKLELKTLLKKFIDISDDEEDFLIKLLIPYLK